MTSMPTSFAGGCGCGAIRYECKAAPVAAINCHCRDCQRASGSAYTTAVIVATAAFVIQKGQVKDYMSKADSGNMVRRSFCPECGAPLFAGNMAAPQFVAIRAASLDDPRWVKPMADIWVSSAQPWDHMAPDVPKFPKNPPIQGP